MTPPPPEFPPFARIPTRTVEFRDPQPRDWLAEFLVHAPECGCAACEPYAAEPASAPEIFGTLNRVARDFLLGLAGAHGVVWLYDAITHGPGLLAMYGL